MIDPNILVLAKAMAKGNGSSSSGNGSASIDVTATVGQTIVVTEVDANGKPTKWEAADYQPRTHWSEVKEILPETTVEIDPEMGACVIPTSFTVEAGQEYTVNYNGAEFVCTCFKGVLLGNGGAVDESMVDTGEPFAIFYESNIWLCLPFDGSTSVTLSITGAVVTKIPQMYIDTTSINQYIDEKAEELAGETAEIARFVLNETEVFDLSEIFGKTFDLLSGSYSDEITGDAAKLMERHMSLHFNYSDPSKIKVEFDLTHDGRTVKYCAFLQVHTAGGFSCGKATVGLDSGFTKIATVFVRCWLDENDTYHCKVTFTTSDL